MDVVVDASVIIAVIADEPEKAALVHLTTGTQLIMLVWCHQLSVSKCASSR
jgi:uncharacterized protein with PIN domain